MEKEVTSSKELIAREHPLAEHFDSKALRTAAGRVPADYWLIPDVELMDQAKPTEIEQRLRVSILLAYMNWLRTGRRIKLTDICAGICSQTHLYDNILKNPYKLVFLFRPVQWAGLRAEHLLPFVTDEIRKILELPLETKDGQVLHKHAEQKLRVMELLDNVLYGDPRNPNYVPLKDRDYREQQDKREQALRAERLALDRERLELDRARLEFEKERLQLSHKS